MKNLEIITDMLDREINYLRHATDKKEEDFERLSELVEASIFIHSLSVDLKNITYLLNK